MAADGNTDRRKGSGSEEEEEELPEWTPYSFSWMLAPGDTESRERQTVRFFEGRLEMNVPSAG